MPTNITFSGWNEFRKKAQNLTSVVFEEIDGEVEDAAAMWEELAKRDAPYDHGRLRQNINKHQVSLMHYDVTSAILYSPYVEWGTGSRAVIPADLRTYAALWWTKKQHIGSRPHPFFFIQRPTVEKFLFDNVRKILTTEH